MSKHIVVVGGGPAGYVAALHAASLGARATLIESDSLGGTCLNRGCIPTKTLVAACSLLDGIHNAAGFGIDIQGKVTAHWSAMLSNATRVVSGMTQGVRSLLSQRGVEVVAGHARLAGERGVHVEGHGKVDGDYVLLCTGSQPVRPSAFPFDGRTVATSDDLLRWDSLPASIAIVGDGVIACEFAFILNTLGVAVTIVGMADRPASTLDVDISNVLGREMRKKGIRFLGGKPVEQIVRTDDAGIEIHRRGADTVRAERTLVCVGRAPNTGGLHLDAAGLAVGNRGEIFVDPFMRTCAPGIYAAGDVTGRVTLAHAASAQARLAVEHMLGHEPAPIDDMMIPTAVFTSPEIGCVGLTEHAARAAGIAVRTGTFDTRGLGKAQAMGAVAGMTKVVADADSGRVLGVHIIGAHASDMVHEAVAAMQHGASVENLVATIRAHPTLSEGLSEAAEDVFGQATHKPSTRPRGERHALAA